MLRSSRRGLGALLGAVLLLLVLAVPAATAEECPVVAVEQEDGSIEYVTNCPPGAGGPGTGDGNGGSGVAPPSCDLSTVEAVANTPYCVGSTACAVNNPSSLTEDRWPMDERPSPEHIYTFTWCETAGGVVDYYWSWWLPEDVGPSLAELAQEAFGRLEAPAFRIGFNPPGRGVVGIPTWFWAGGGGGTITGSSALGVVAIGDPAYLELDPGDGSTIRRCAFVTADGDACAHTYRRASVRGSGTSGGQPAYVARMRLVYDVRFENSGAPLEIGGLPTSLESPWTTEAVPVAEIQSVVGP